MGESRDFDYKKAEQDLIKHILYVHKLFVKDSPIDDTYFNLDLRLTVLTVTNAISDIRRSSQYHSKTGPSDWKIAAFVGRWVAKQKPIQIQINSPLNLVNDGLVRVNASFATYITQSLLKVEIYPKLNEDLQYCYEFRNMEGDAICLLLQHSLSYSQKN